MPAVLPPAAAGIALLLAFGRNGPVGSIFADWGYPLAFTPVAVVFAQAFVASPFYVLEATAAFAGADRTLEEAAVLDGAGTLALFRRITLPLARAHLASGASVAWARALGEFGATILFAGSLAGTTQTMPLAIYLGFEYDLDRAVALSLILLVVSALVLLAVRLLLPLERARPSRIEGV
jgi:molybdate transport system permease protein